MKIVVVGPGALGGLLYSLLRVNTDHEVVFLDHNPRRAAFLRDHGLLLLKSGKKQRVDVRIFSTPDEIGEADAVLLCVKSNAVADCLGGLPALFASHSLLVAFQNGISHLDLLAQASFLKGHFAIGVTSEGATLAQDGQVLHGGKGITRIGFPAPVGGSSLESLERLVVALNDAGLETIIEKDIVTQVWNKLLVNVGINALTVIYDCQNGELLEREEARRTLAAAVSEAATVARALKIPIVPDPVALAEQVCRATAGNTSSMLQDIRKKRKTEITAINGAIVREAGKLGIPVPVNADLLKRVQKIEEEVF